MDKTVRLTMAGLMLLVGCGKKPQPPGTPRPEKAAARWSAPRPQLEPHPLDRRASFVFDDVPLPQVISRLAREPGLLIAVSPTIPVEEWSKHRVTLHMADVTVRAFLDWLVRPLRARYAVEADGGAWLSRSDDLLESEPMELRSYRVPTHVVTDVALRGALVFEREQRAVLDTLHACLRYLEDRRPGCRLEFHGSDDLLVARLPARGHARTLEVLHAMRYGSPPRSLPRPSRAELRGKLAAAFEWTWPPAPPSRVLARIAEVAGVNLGWGAGRVGQQPIRIPAGNHTLQAMLDAAVRQTRLGRYALEPGHGIWLYPEGQPAALPSSGAVAWDRAFVRAYGTQLVLARLSPEALLAQLQKRVDPGQWATGLPAAAVFVATGRLIVVHDEAGQDRVAYVVQNMLGRARSATETGKKGD